MSNWHGDYLRQCQACPNTCIHGDSYKRSMAVSSPLRYGMRKGAVSPPPPGAGPRYRSQCCWLPTSACGGGVDGTVHDFVMGRDFTATLSRLPKAAPINSVDIISCANRTEDVVATSDQTSNVSVRDHVLYPGTCLLKKRCVLARPPVCARLAEYGEGNGIKEDHIILDRLPRFRFGGNRAEKRGNDKFRELSERLKRGTVPVPPPRTRHSKTTPPISPSASQDESTPVKCDVRVVPLRSASFSQVDYCPDDNKYIRRKSDENEQASPTTNTLPRPKNVGRSAAVPSKQDAFTSTRPESNVDDVRETNADIPEVQITPESPEKTTVRTQNNTNCSQDRRRDKSRRRKGIYLSQWPAEYHSGDDDVILNKYEEEDAVCGCDETDKVIQETLLESGTKGCSSPPEEPLSPDEGSICLEWPSVYTKKFLSQCPEEKDSFKISVSRSDSILRSDSLSEGEPELSERRSDQISFVPSDLSDCEGRSSTNIETTSPPIPRRYSKRPLRGPYGQMLEAEMKKPDCKKNVSNDLKFLDDLSSGSVNAGKSKQTRYRSSCNSSIDDTSPVKSQQNTPKQQQAANKRKVSADSLIVEPADQKLVPNHQRTTSSPSKLEGLTKTEVTSELLEQLLRGSSEELISKKTGQQQQDDTRTHVLIELYDNERSYVESLEIIATNYWEPLKKPENSFLLESNLVEEIFSQIPFLLNHHKNFLMQLKSRLEHWDSRQIIGDVFLEMFSQSEVIDNYTTYVNNWKRSRDIIKSAQQSKPAFGRFLEATARQHIRKLALDSLLIKPIQKFPKYELLLQRLIKHTNETHPDYKLLLEAQKQVHEQLLKINCTEKEALDMERLRELESLIEGVLDLVAPDRQYIRHDMVIMSHGGGPRKERAVFLFTDLLLIAGIKRRSGPINKKNNTVPNNSNSLEGNKYKLMMKVLLEDVEIIRSKDDNLKQIQIIMDDLNEDISVLNQITELSWTLHCSHAQLDELVKEMLGNLNKRLHEQQNSDVQLSVLDLTVLTQNGIENISIVFPKAEIRTSWEETLLDAKTKLLLTGDRRPTPEMMATVPIRKTRAGLQFTCAAPTLSENGRDVWVCNSDGYVGQVCVLTLNEKPEPTVTSCNGVCNTRILCIASVPGPGLGNRLNPFSSIKNRDKLQQQKAMQFDSSSSSDDDDNYEEETHKHADRSESSSIHMEEYDKLSTMWLGTEDGCIHIFNSNDNIRIKKNKIKLQLGGSVLSLIYLDNRVFASLGNGYISIFDRDSKGGWNTNSPQTMSLGTISTPISKMVVFNSKIYCAFGNTVLVFNPQTLEKENSFAVSNEPSKSISCLLVSGNALWVSLQNAAIIKCYHAISFEFLCETNVAPAVTKMLTSCDDIIRQHKAACLRVTALVHCKDLLWIGTSAGVLLTMPLPHVTPSTTKLHSVPAANGVPHGHTGHVRILTSVEMPYPIIRKGTPLKKSMKLKCHDHHIAKTTKFLVISGGDGYEDFRTSNISEVAGREDSTNHLLLWNI
ncbi:rho guanine nucleotide exchange factor 17-like isoform X2 [Cylas formicarius]|uniref:rho guanine nucleotide exchange factor 17-like isoform X2 n=1 Tax=Cylas formicarius TaxID=197179 RepID=UPI0029588279|nr:rho guanine nucleotide exchange factor 17-like isoform X2 [Cylas formicarius]